MRVWLASKRVALTGILVLFTLPAVRKGTSIPSHLTRDCLEAVMATFDLGRSHQNLCSSVVENELFSFLSFSAVALESRFSRGIGQEGRKEGRSESGEWRAARAEEVGNKHHTTLRFYTDGAYLVHIMLMLLAQYNMEHRTCIIIHVQLFPTIFAFY